jgi:uncharacterized protein (DUF934 family)
MADKILWQNDAVAEDAWTHAETADGEGHIILPLPAYAALTAGERKAGSNRLAVLLQPLESIESILEDLPHLSMVALAFPAFSNGTSHSKAALLRGKHGYKGDIRAVGDVLFDQIPLMIRNGFSSFEITNQPTVKQLQSGKSGGIPLYYQPAAKPANDAKSYTWRHRAAS